MTLTTLPAPRGPGRAFLRPLSEGWPLLPVLIYLILVLPVYIENNAGSGLNLPQNLLAWGAMMLCVLLAALRAALTGRLLLSRPVMWAILAVLLLMLPWVWTPDPLWQRHALPRLAGIVGALCVALALHQVRLSGILRHILLYVVVLSALVQAAEAMLQAWLPDLAYRLMDFVAPSPYGIFQQRNLLASWLATGYGVALYLLLCACTRAQVFARAVVLYPLCIALTLTSSRTGWLGVLVMTVLSGLAVRSRLRGRPLAVLGCIMLVSSLLASCAATAHWGMPEGRADLTHTLSNRERVVMLRGALAMAAEHPLAGSGLGSLEALFPDVLERAGLQARSDTITHPHNELLYVLDEGGVLALTGLLVLAGVWLWPAVHRLRRRDARWLLCLSGLPVVIHMMTEYPLYLSAPHLLLLLLLYRVGMPGAALCPVRVPVTLRVTALPALCLAACATLAVLAAGLMTQYTLTRAEADMNAGLIPTLPAADWRSLTQAERLDYDRHMLAANAPGFARNPRAMAAFTVWGTRWLAVHNNAEVSAALMFIARRRGDHNAAERERARAARVFVSDDRFIRGTE